MKKLLKAFTLAEVLITLGIVGIVAKLTLPALTQNVMEQTSITGLGKAINTLETVNKQILLDRNTKSLGFALNPSRNNIQIDAPTYLSSLTNYTNGIYNASLSKNLNGRSANRRVFTTKDGIMFIDMDIQHIGNNSRRYAGGTVPEIAIDINGHKGPNKYGKDQFVVLLEGYGQVIPFGSNQHSTDFSNMYNWQEKCPSNKTRKPSEPRACTGSIVDNNMKIMYAYNSL